MHIPVLLHEAVEGLNARRGKVAVDATLGAGGHARLICERLGNGGRLLAIDADRTSLLRAAAFAREGGCEVIPMLGNFRDLTALLQEAGISKIDAILFDLGVRSNQLEDSGRGFSFKKPEPLIMTFAADAGPETLTACDVVNDWSEEHLADIFRGFGEERHAAKIARAIVLRREERPIETSTELGDIIVEAVPPAYRRGKIHPATRAFQAIRIAVNDELGALRAGLAAAWNALSLEGRMAVISFHSLEDRIVKNFMRDKARAGEAWLLTKKPIVPSEVEAAANPRARSAKLRIVEKRA